jgi:hypothetical protein
MVILNIICYITIDYSNGIPCKNSITKYLTISPIDHCRSRCKGREGLSLIHSFIQIPHHYDNDGNVSFDTHTILPFFREDHFTLNWSWTQDLEAWI